MSHMSPDVIAALTEAARSVSLEPALLLAVVQVETGGDAFDADGQPRFLCEPAVFYKELPFEKRAQALAAGVAAKKWSRDGYKDQGTHVGRAARFARMVAIDENAAYRSISMGLGQPMGFNCSLAGYRTARDMFEAFRDVGAQARAVVAVLAALGAMEPLKAHDWVKVARIYNGPGERQNAYDSKLAAAYAHWECALATGQTGAPPEGCLGLGSHGEPVRAIQAALLRAGARIRVDGTFGPKTLEAVASFEVRRGLPDTRGIVDQATADAILAAADQPLPQGAREVAGEDTVAPVSRIVQSAAKLRAGSVVTGVVGGGTAVGGAVSAIHDQVNSAMDKVDAAKATYQRFADILPADWLAHAAAWVALHPMPVAGSALAALAAGAGVVAHSIVAVRVEDERTGATV